MRGKSHEIEEHDFTGQVGRLEVRKIGRLEVSIGIQ
jgi:hypothetical protein